MHYGGIFDFTEKAARLEEVERELADGAVWDNPDRAQKLGKERVALDQVVSVLTGLNEDLSEYAELAELAQAEQDQTFAG